MADDLNRLLLSQCFILEMQHLNIVLWKIIYCNILHLTQVWPQHLGTLGDQTPVPTGTLTQKIPNQGVVRGVLGISNIPNSKGQYPKFKGRISQYPIVKGQISQFKPWGATNTPNSSWISQYPSFREAISQYPQKNDQYPNIPYWSNNPLKLAMLQHKPI